MSGDNGSTEFYGKALEYTLELDLHVFFTPLMQDWGDGIVMTRTLQLPFPPDDKTTIGGVRLKVTANHSGIDYAIPFGT